MNWTAVTLLCVFAGFRVGGENSNRDACTPKLTLELAVTHMQGLPNGVPLRRQSLAGGVRPAGRHSRHDRKEGL